MSIDSQRRQRFLCQSDAISEGQYLECRLPSVDVATIGHDVGPIDVIATRYRGAVRAWLNVCPHQGRSLSLAPGRFITDDDNRLVCCVHGAVFEPNEGRCISGPCLNAYLKALPVIETNGEVCLLGLED